MQAIKLVIRNRKPLHAEHSCKNSFGELATVKWLKFISKLVKFISSWGLEVKLIEMKEGED